MEFQELRNDLQTICDLFKLGDLVGYQTEANNPIQGFNTAYFTTKGSKETFKYHFKN